MFLESLRDSLASQGGFNCRAQHCRCRVAAQHPHFDGHCISLIPLCQVRPSEVRLRAWKSFLISRPDLGMEFSLCLFIEVRDSCEGASCGRTDAARSDDSAHTLLLARPTVCLVSISTEKRAGKSPGRVTLKTENSKDPHVGNMTLQYGWTRGK